MNFVDIITKKKLGVELENSELEFFVNGVVSETIPSYQQSAFLMAIRFVGMTDKETAYLTKLMANSGEKLDLKKFNLTLDKHSSGGVGDSATFIFLPVMASIGVTMAKMSGRGLGFTGGTVDKIESILGFKTTLSEKQFYENLTKSNLVLAGQSEDMCIADKKLYALRDVTSTVDSIPLIVASIMSKKLACGSKNILLDVKCGNGAFMKSEEDAIMLAEKMVSIAKLNDKNCFALVTDMSEPLADYVGNALEIFGAIEVLNGKRNKLSELCKYMFDISLEMLNLPKINFYDLIQSKKPLEKFKEMIVNQCGDVDFVENPNLLIATKKKIEVYAKKSGYIKEINCISIAELVKNLGGGREKLDDIINLNVGVKINVIVGDFVEENACLGTIYSDFEDNNQYINMFDKAFNISETKVVKNNLIIKIIKS